MPDHENALTGLDVQIDTLLDKRSEDQTASTTTRVKLPVSLSNL